MKKVILLTLIMVGGVAVAQPEFLADVIYREAGTVGRKYDGWNELRPSVKTLNKKEKLVFKKVSGPKWLNVHQGGYLNGLPTENDIGLNEFRISVTDSNGKSDETLLRFNVQNSDVVFKKGRIAISSDGKHHDPDDWVATTASLAILAAEKLQDKLSLYVYSDHVWGSSERGEAQMIKSALGGAEKFGFDKSRFISGVENPERAYNSMRDQILESTAENPLVVIAAGPMQVVGEALARAKVRNPESLKNVRIISHSTWNNRHADLPAKFEKHSGWTWREMIDAFTDDGVVFDKIQDQNQVESATEGLSTSRASVDKKHFWEPWYFMRDYNKKDAQTNAAIQWIYGRMVEIDLPDISDAGMLYYLVTGDVAANPSKLNSLFNSGF